MHAQIIGDDQPGFFDALAAVTAGEAVLLGERWTSYGVRQIAVEPVTRRNADGEPERRGRVSIGHEWYALSLKEYTDWQEKWWREVVQNAVDAGATEVALDAVALSDGTWKVSCADNGRGMDEDVILNKFLVLGGTTKILGGTTGGFGKAKEIIILPWISWSVASHGTEVTGTGVDYVVRKTAGSPGTILSVVMPADNHTSEAHAISFISKCWLPHVKFTVNGKRVKADLESGENLRSFRDVANVYYNQDAHLSFSQLLVRSNGIYHFGIYVSNKVPGVLILDITGRTVDLLTANRDSFRDDHLRWGVESFVSEVAADVLSKLQSKKGGMERVYKGSGKFKAEEKELREAVLGDLNISLAPTERMTDEQVEQFLDAVFEMRERETRSRSLPESPSAPTSDEPEGWVDDPRDIEIIHTAPPPGASVVAPAENVSGPGEALVHESPALPVAPSSDPSVAAGQAVPVDGVVTPGVASAIAGVLGESRDAPPPAASPTTSGDLTAVAQEVALPVSVTDAVAATVSRYQPATPEASVPDLSPENDEEMDAPLDLRVTVEAVRAHLDVGIKGSNHLEAVVKQIAWEPDFFILNYELEYGEVKKGGEIYKVPKKFMPEHMTPALRKLARLWAELCRFVLIQLGSERSFGVGWIFSKGTLAAHYRFAGESWLLLNPFRSGRMYNRRDNTTAKIYSASDMDDLDLLYALAIHECTHVADGVNMHNEAFSSALTLNIARTYGRQRQVRAIRQAVVSRKFSAGKMRGRQVP